MANINEKLLRIGVFYDGGFFYHVSNYYRYSHQRKKRLSIRGLHEFIRRHAAEVEGVDPRYSQIVDSHFFRGRFSARQTREHDKLFAERAFDDVLMNEGVTAHYLPIPDKTERGIDVWLSLEAFELAVYKRYNILVLIAGDSDFVPLVRKVNSIGSRVMVLGWDFEYTDNFGNERKTVTSTRLLSEVTHEVQMHEIIDNKTKRNDPIINALFVDLPHTPLQSGHASAPVPLQQLEHQGAASASPDSEKRISGTILNLKEGFGFIRCQEHPENVFFHFSSLVNQDFYALKKGDEVSFLVEQGGKGPAAQDVRVASDENSALN